MPGIYAPDGSIRVTVANPDELSLSRFDSFETVLDSTVPEAVKVIETLGSDGRGRATWIRSDVGGVRGKANLTSPGADMPSGMDSEYIVKLVGGGGTGATARVVIRDGIVNSHTDGACDAIILEPGTGYTSAPSLSTNPVDWTELHSNGTLMAATWVAGRKYFVEATVMVASVLYRATAEHTASSTFATDAANWQAITPTFPVITFDLDDGFLSHRNENGYEYLLDFDGEVSLRHFGGSTEREVDSSAALQEAVRALLRGRSQIVHQYGGGPRAGGIIRVPVGSTWLNDQYIYINSTGTPTGTECVGLEIRGVTMGSMRTIRPDAAHSGSKLLHGGLIFGDMFTNGNIELVSRGCGIRDLEITGHIGLWGLQHAPLLNNLRVVPDSPAGVLSPTGYRHGGFGIYARKCSLIDMRSCIITGGRQNYFTRKTRLGGVLIEDCDHFIFDTGNIAFCEDPLVIRAQGDEQNSVVDLRNMNFEANLQGIKIVRALSVTAQISSLGSNDTDSSRPLVTIGDIGNIADVCKNVTIHHGSLSGTPIMAAVDKYDTVGNNQVRVPGDFTIRFAPLTQVNVLSSAGNFTAEVTAVEFDYDDFLTTVTLDTTSVTTAVTALDLVTPPPLLGIDVVRANGITVEKNTVSNMETIVHFRANAKDCEYTPGQHAAVTNEFLADTGMTWRGSGKTWTPDVTFVTRGDLDVTFSPGNQIGRWTPIPGTDLIYVEFSLVFTPVFSTSSGAFGITGLPMLAKNSGGINQGTITNISTQFSWGTSRTTVMPYLIGTDRIGIRGMGSGAAGSGGLVASNLTSGSAHTLIGAITYKV